VPLVVPAEDRAVVEADYSDLTDRIAEVVPHFFKRVWNERRVELTELMWDEGIVFHSPVKPEPVVGRAALLEYVGAIMSAFSDLHFEIDDVVAQGDRVVLRVTQTGRHTGDYFGLPPTGRAVRMSEVFIFRARPGEPLGARISTIWLHMNALELMQQLKLFPTGNPPRPLLRAVIAVQRLVGRGR
jgi:predicted ester cyclase